MQMNVQCSCISMFIVAQRGGESMKLTLESFYEKLMKLNCQDQVSHIAVSLLTVKSVFLRAFFFLVLLIRSARLFSIPYVHVSLSLLRHN